MTDKRKHRGPAPQDGKIFAANNLVILRKAVCDMSMLLTRGYAEKSTLKLVGDRYSLTARQRLAVRRSVCSDQQLRSRVSKQVSRENIKNRQVVIDGFNVLITMEALLSSAPVFICRDGCFRDLSGIHGSYRRVSETTSGLEIIAGCLNNLKVKSVRWLLDKPVSNSGKLKTIIGQMASKNKWPWQIELTFNPDTELCRTDEVVITSDSEVLDNCGRWFNLIGQILQTKKKLPNTKLNLIDMSV